LESGEELFEVNGRPEDNKKRETQKATFMGERLGPKISVAVGTGDVRETEKKVDRS